MKLINKIFREANFLNLFSNFFRAAFGIASFALLTRSLTIDIFGQWVIYQTAGNFMDMFRFGITNTGVVRYLSGAEGEERFNFIGSNALIGLVSTLALVVIIWIVYFAFKESIKESGYELFFVWYPIAAILNLPYNTATVIMQADQQFGKLLWTRLINSGGFFLLLLLNYMYFNMTVVQIIWVQFGVNLFLSAICFINGWDGLRHLFRASKDATKKILHFGKFTTFTIIGTNLLRSADTFIISLSPLGTAAVALYSIPMKLTELQQIPLRSFATTAFPKMSKSSIRGIFYQYSGAITIFFVLVSLIIFIFADYFVLFMGGPQYLGNDPITGFNATTIVRIFCLYGLLLPIDRMTGICLESINRPDKNMIKVIFMIITNIIGDLIAVYIFRSLEAIAVASIIFTTLGVMIGYYFLHKELNLNFRMIRIEGEKFYLNLYSKLKNKGFWL